MLLFWGGVESNYQLPNSWHSQRIAMMRQRIAAGRVPLSCSWSLSLQLLAVFSRLGFVCVNEVSIGYWTLFNIYVGLIRMKIMQHKWHSVDNGSSVYLVGIFHVNSKNCPLRVDTSRFLNLANDLRIVHHNRRLPYLLLFLLLNLVASKYQPHSALAKGQNSKKYFSSFGHFQHTWT